MSDVARYSINYTNRFKKDVKLSRKRGLDLALLEKAIEILSEKGSLPEEYLPHPLKGKYSGAMECHLKPGTHSDLF